MHDLVKVTVMPLASKSKPADDEHNSLDLFL